MIFFYFYLRGIYFKTKVTIFVTWYECDFYQIKKDEKRITTRYNRNFRIQSNLIKFLTTLIFYLVKKLVLRFTLSRIKIIIKMFFLLFFNFQARTIILTFCKRTFCVDVLGCLFSGSDWKQATLIIRNQNIHSITFYHVKRRPGNLCEFLKS
jgi:hypothetical protein